MTTGVNRQRISLKKLCALNPCIVGAGDGIGGRCQPDTRGTTGRYSTGQRPNTRTVVFGTRAHHCCHIASRHLAGIDQSTCAQGHDVDTCGTGKRDTFLVCRDRTRYRDRGNVRVLISRDRHSAFITEHAAVGDDGVAAQFGRNGAANFVVTGRSANRRLTARTHGHVARQREEVAIARRTHGHVISLQGALPQHPGGDLRAAKRDRARAHGRHAVAARDAGTGRHTNGLP